MPSSAINRDGLLESIKKDFPEIVFKSGRKFLFRPPRTIVLGPPEADELLILLHELGHALSGHSSFDMDVERLKMEREAWDKARELADKYGVDFDEAVAERELDTYRDWLDHKSRCPRCGLVCYQTKDGNYHCPRCENFT
jgi:hypothetical protein